MSNQKYYCVSFLCCYCAVSVSRFNRLFRRHFSPPPLPMSTIETEMEPLTSGASNRIIPLLKAFRASLIFVYTFFLSFLLFIRPRLSSPSSLTAAPSSPRKHLKRKWLVREEEDTFRRRALAQDVGMGHDDGCCRWNTSIFYGVRNNALFCRSWFPVTGDLK